MQVLVKWLVQGAACGVMLGVVLLLGGRFSQPRPVEAQAPNEAKIVTAQQFVVKDVQGRDRAVLGVDEDQTVAFNLYDFAKKETASLYTLADGTTGLLLHGNAEKRLLSLSIEKDDAILAMTDARGEPRVMWTHMQNGLSGLVFKDAQATPRLELVAYPDGAPLIRLSDAAGTARLKCLLTAKDGTPSLTFTDKTGKTVRGLP